MDFEFDTELGLYKYRLHKIPYLNLGRDIALAAEMDTYKDNKQLVNGLFSYVARITDDGHELLLKTPELINNHVPDVMTGLKIEEFVIKKLLNR